MRTFHYIYTCADEPSENSERIYTLKELPQPYRKMAKQTRDYFSIDITTDLQRVEIKEIV